MQKPKVVDVLDKNQLCDLINLIFTIYYFFLKFKCSATKTCPHYFAKK